MDKKLKIALAQLNPLVGDVSGNIDKLISIRAGLKDDVDILVAPELYVSGYPIDDLVLREDFLNLVEKEINKLADSTKDKKSAIIVGAPRKDKKSIKNSVFVIENGKISNYILQFEDNEWLVCTVDIGSPRNFELSLEVASYSKGSLLVEIDSMNVLSLIHI